MRPAARFQSWRRRRISSSCAVFFSYYALFFSSCNIFSSKSARTRAAFGDSGPVVSVAMGAKASTERTGVVRPAEAVDFNGAEAGLGAVVEAVLESSTVLGLAAALIISLAPMAPERPSGLRDNGFPGVLAMSAAQEKSEMLLNSNERCREGRLVIGKTSSLWREWEL